MVELVSRSPCAGLVPLGTDNARLTEADLGPLTLLAPYPGREAALSAALESAHGMAFPEPGRVTEAAGGRAIWFGMGQALLVGSRPDPGLSAHAAVTDQSDAWAAVMLDGPGAQAVLARLVPVDLGAAGFAPGHTMRSQIFHMPGSITRTGRESFLLMTFRSMAATLVHDLDRAMRSVAARARVAVDAANR